MAIRSTTDERLTDCFVESPTRTGKTAVEVVGMSSGGGSLTTQTVSFSISALQIGLWVLVPTISLLNVFNVEVYDATNTTQLFIDWRISSSNILEIRSNVAATYTIRIIGT